MQTPTKSLTLSCVITNAWQWRPSKGVQAASVPVAGDAVGLAVNYSVAWGCFALTASIRAVKKNLIAAPPAKPVFYSARGGQL